MAEVPAGARSGRSRVRGYEPAPVRKESQNPSQSDSGMGWDRGGQGRNTKLDRTPMRQVYAKELAWAERHLPGEYGPFVALAIESVKRQGGQPSTGTVMAHLEALGRDAKTREVRNG